LINRRLALLFEFQGYQQRVQLDEASETTQMFALGAVQYWITPRFWVKGGLGYANLSTHYDSVSEGGSGFGSGAPSTTSSASSSLSRARNHSGNAAKLPLRLDVY
jgi:hypothetical protein